MARIAIIALIATHTVGNEYTTVPILLEFGLNPFLIFKTPLGKDFGVELLSILNLWFFNGVYSQILLGTPDLEQKNHHRSTQLPPDTLPGR